MNRCAALFGLLALPVLCIAQTTYRWTDPNTGSTIFSDQPPPAHIKRSTKTEAPEPKDEKQQSFATKTAAEKFPVVLFTATNCQEPCQQARSLLNARNVPFREKLVQPGTPELGELKQATGGEMVPSIVVGTQSYKGFDAYAWNSLLDLAMYPRAGATPKQ